MQSTLRVLANMPRVQPGQIVSHEVFNQLVDAVRGLATAMSGPESQVSYVTLAKLNEDLEQYERDKGGDRMQYDRSVTAGNDPSRDSGADTGWLADYQNQTWLEGEHHWLGHLPSSNTLIPLCGFQMYLGTLDGTLSQGGSATMSIYKRDGGSWSDTTLNIVVYDWILSVGETIASGKRVIAIGHRQSRLAVVVAAQC